MTGGILHEVAREGNPEPREGDHLAGGRRVSAARGSRGGSGKPRCSGSMNPLSAGRIFPCRCRDFLNIIGIHCRLPSYYISGA